MAALAGLSLAEVSQGWAPAARDVPANGKGHRPASALPDGVSRLALSLARRSPSRRSSCRAVAGSGPARTRGFQPPPPYVPRTDPYEPFAVAAVELPRDWWGRPFVSYGVHAARAALADADIAWPDVDLVVGPARRGGRTSRRPAAPSGGRRRRRRRQRRSSGPAGPSREWPGPGAGCAARTDIHRPEVPRSFTTSLAPSRASSRRTRDRATSRSDDDDQAVLADPSSCRLLDLRPTGRAAAVPRHPRSDVPPTRARFV